MENEELLNKIHKLYPSLSKTQKKIAESIFESWESIAFISPREFGEKLGISEATIIRFAQQLGYENYSDFRQYIRNLIQLRLTPAEKMTVSVGKMKNDQNFLPKVLLAEAENLRKAINRIPSHDFINAVDLLNKAKKVFVIGFGVSASLCHFLEFRFRRMQIDTHILTHGDKSFYEYLLMAKEGDVIIGIGFFRCAKEILNAFDYAQKHRIETIAVTHSPVSELARLATVTLVANRGPVEEINSLTVPMAILNALVISLAEKEGTRSLEALKQLDQIQTLYRQEWSESDHHDF